MDALRNLIITRQEKKYFNLDLIITCKLFFQRNDFNYIKKSTFLWHYIYYLCDKDRFYEINKFKTFITNSNILKLNTNAYKEKREF